MKKIALVSLFALVISAAFAQTEQGRMMVGGTLSISGSAHKTKNNNTTTTIGKYTYIDFTPQFGYFIINNLAVGAGIGLSSTVSKDPDNSDKEVNTVLQFKPFVRYYLPFKLFFHGDVGVGTSNDKYTVNSNTTTYKDNVTSGSLAVGYAWFLNKNIAIEPMAGISSIRYKDKDSSAKYSETGPFVKVGFQIYLGK